MLSAGSVDARWLATLGRQRRALLMRIMLQLVQALHIVDRSISND
jgi:hypothetical protein